MKSEQDVLIYSLTFIHLTVNREWRHFDFHARLTKQNFSSETTEPSQSYIKKKTITRGVSSKLTIQILSFPNRVTRWGSNECSFFPVVCS